MLPVFEIMMEKLGSCNIAILHYGHRWYDSSLDWFNIYQTVKVMEASEATNSRIEKTSFNIFKSRFSADCNLAIFLSFDHLQNDRSRKSADFAVHNWARMLSSWYIVYDRKGWQYPLAWEKAIITIVTTQTNQDALRGIYFNANELGIRWNDVGVLFVMRENKFKVCYWHRIQPHEVTPCTGQRSTPTIYSAAA
ncbi:hypothetical protein Fcan01_25292 [Folsomia candida]|uniref:Uncharacterized protein n=1 Tax=Folsomia candida TaxID=158441 RepID=A0A226D2T3_FOLCA|nr:hypothetical protein Fcan01_25292 [Folsomia candida]